MSKWIIENMDRNPETGFVWRVHWRCINNDKQVYGSLDVQSGETFVQFEDLTEEIVLSWVKNNLEDFEKIDAAMKTASINNVAIGLPWKDEA